MFGNRLTIGSYCAWCYVSAAIYTEHFYLRTPVGLSEFWRCFIKMTILYNQIRAFWLILLALHHSMMRSPLNNMSRTIDFSGCHPCALNRCCTTGNAAGVIVESVSNPAYQCSLHKFAPVAFHRLLLLYSLYAYVSQRVLQKFVANSFNIWMW